MRPHDKNLILDLLSLPASPFAEGQIAAFVHNFCATRARWLKVAADPAGNLLVRYRHPKANVKQPICLCAHMDHPGFRAERMLNERTLKARWLGTVLPEYFDRAPVRFWVEGRWFFGRISAIQMKNAGLEKPFPLVDTVEITMKRGGVKIPAGSIGMWDFPDARICDGKLFARGCDDAAGAAAMLCCMDELCRKNIKTEAYFLFTRAEEVGFVGAIAACRHGTIPKRCVVVAVENSSVIPGVELGAGPILRVGDKLSIFDPRLTRWCGQIAERLRNEDKTFRFQRKLMDGGTCEATVYNELGYTATCICLALGNYHNMDKTRRKLGPEFVSVNDVDHLIKWFTLLVSTPVRMTDSDEPLRRRFKQLESRYNRLLYKTAM